MLFRSIKEAAGKFLASPQFNDAMKAYILAGGAMRANVLARQKQMVRTLIYKKWAAALGDDATARIAAVGPVVYLTEQTKQ